jgi:hypothetical protein
MSKDLELCNRCGLFTPCRDCNAKRLSAYYKTIPIYVPLPEIIYTKHSIRGIQMLPRVCGANEALRQELLCTKCQRRHYKPVVFEKHGYAICTKCAST